MPEWETGVSVRQALSIRGMASLLALLSLTAGGCEPEVGRIVWLIGDSTASETLEELHFVTSARDRGDVVIPIAAIPGSALARDLPYWTGRLASAKGPTTRVPRPDAVIVSLGTNDLGDLAPPFDTWPKVDTQEELAQALDTFLGALPPATRVIWVIPSSPVSPPDRRTHFGQGLAAARGRWPQLELLAPDPVWFTGPDQDGLHYTSTGEPELAKALLARLGK